MIEKITEFSHTRFQEHIKQIHDTLYKGPRSKFTEEAFHEISRLIKHSTKTADLVQKHINSEGPSKLWSALLLFRLIRHQRHKATKIIFRVREAVMKKEQKAELEKQFGGFLNQVLSLEKIATNLVIDHMPGVFGIDTLIKFLDLLDTSKKDLIFRLKEVHDLFRKCKELRDPHILAIILRLTKLSGFNEEQARRLISEVLSHKIIKNYSKLTPEEQKEIIVLIVNSNSLEELHKALDLAQEFGVKKIADIVGVNKLLVLEHLIYYNNAEWVTQNIKRLRNAIDPQRITPQNIKWFVQILKSGQNLTTEEIIGIVEQIFKKPELRPI